MLPVEFHWDEILRWFYWCCKCYSYEMRAKDVFTVVTEAFRCWRSCEVPLVLRRSRVTRAVEQLNAFRSYPSVARAGHQRALLSRKHYHYVYVREYKDLGEIYVNNPEQIYMYSHVVQFQFFYHSFVIYFISMMMCQLGKIA